MFLSLQHFKYFTSPSSYVHNFREEVRSQFICLFLCRCGIIPPLASFKIQKYDHHFECEVKWALESITMNKASGGDGIPVELFQILKDDAVKVLHSVRQQIWKTQ